MIRQPAFQLSLMPLVVGFVVISFYSNGKKEVRGLPVFENQLEAVAVVARASTTVWVKENFIFAMKLADFY